MSGLQAFVNTSSHAPAMVQNLQAYTAKPRFIVFVWGPEKNDGCGKTIDAGPIWNE
jgi:hypothetical protein